MSNAANAAGGLILALAILGGGPASYGPMAELAAKEKQRAIADMQTRSTTLDQKIDENQCTVEARAKSGVPKPTDNASFDGTYSGPGKTDSWCVSPTLEAKVKGGKIEGRILSNSNARSYVMKGQIYDSGDVVLWFRQPGSTVYTDDVEGRISGETLTFTARLDTTSKECTYRFSVGRR